MLNFASAGQAAVGLCVQQRPVDCEIGAGRFFKALSSYIARKGDEPSYQCYRGWFPHRRLFDDQKGASDREITVEEIMNWLRRKVQLPFSEIHYLRGMAKVAQARLFLSLPALVVSTCLLVSTWKPGVCPI